MLTYYHYNNFNDIFVVYYIVVKNVQNILTSHFVYQKHLLIMYSKCF